MEDQQEVEGTGDDMREVYPPDYQEFLDKQEPLISDRDSATEALIAESVELDNGR